MGSFYHCFLKVLASDFTHMWNLGNKRAKGKKRERQTKKQIVTNREQTDGHQRGVWWGDG